MSEEVLLPTLGEPAPHCLPVLGHLQRGRGREGGGGGGEREREGGEGERGRERGIQQLEVFQGSVR